MTNHAANVEQTAMRPTDAASTPQLLNAADYQTSPRALAAIVSDNAAKHLPPMSLTQAEHLPGANVVHAGTDVIVRNVDPKSGDQIVRSYNSVTGELRFDYDDNNKTDTTVSNIYSHGKLIKIMEMNPNGIPDVSKDYDPLTGLLTGMQTTTKDKNHNSVERDDTYYPNGHLKSRSISRSQDACSIEEQYDQSGHVTRRVEEDRQPKSEHETTTDYNADGTVKRTQVVTHNGGSADVVVTDKRGVHHLKGSSVSNAKPDALQDWLHDHFPGTFK